MHLLITQFADRVRIKLISQLIKGISRVLQKLLKGAVLQIEKALISDCLHVSKVS